MKKTGAAQMFEISRNTIDLWLKRQEETGDYQAQTIRPHRIHNRIRALQKLGLSRKKRRMAIANGMSNNERHSWKNLTQVPKNDRVYINESGMDEREDYGLAGANRASDLKPSSRGDGVDRST